MDSGESKPLYCVRQPGRIACKTPPPSTEQDSGLYYDVLNTPQVTLNSAYPVAATPLTTAWGTTVSYGPYEPVSPVQPLRQSVYKPSVHDQYITSTPETQRPSEAYKQWSQFYQQVFGTVYPVNHTYGSLRSAMNPVQSMPSCSYAENTSETAAALQNSYNSDYRCTTPEIIDSVLDVQASYISHQMPEVAHHQLIGYYGHETTENGSSVNTSVNFQSPEQSSDNENYGGLRLPHIVHTSYYESGRSSVNDSVYENHDGTQNIMRKGQSTEKQYDSGYNSDLALSPYQRDEKDNSNIQDYSPLTVAKNYPNINICGEQKAQQENVLIPDPYKNDLENLTKTKSVACDKTTSKRKAKEIGSNNIDSHGFKRTRHNEPLNMQATEVMTIWYENHLDNPYPSKSDKDKMAALGGISVTQVKSWFANKRNRSNNTRPKVQKRQLEDQLLTLCHQLARDAKAPSMDNAFIIQQLSAIMDTSGQ